MNERRGDGSRTGNTGNTASIGGTDNTGNTGNTGSTGNTGNTGSTGSTGSTGRVGRVGRAGRGGAASRRGLLATPWLPAVALFLLAVLPFLGSVFGEFVFDDRGILVENPALWQTSPVPALASKYWPESGTAGLYRPVALFTYWLDGKIWGRAPEGFHVTNLLLHACVTLLAFAVFRRLFPKERIAAFLASALLAVHPLRSEAVIAIVGRAELLAAGFALLAYWLALRHAAARKDDASAGLSLGLSAFALCLAMLSKESAMGLLALAVFHATPFAPEPDQTVRRRWRTIAIAWGAALVPVWLLRIRILGGVVGLEMVPLVDNPLAHASALERVATALGLQGWLTLSLFWPFKLSADYSYPQITATPGWMAAGAAVLILAGLAVWTLLRRPNAPLRWALVFVVATGALTSNIVLPIGTVLGDRLTYLPTVGSLFAAAYLLAGTRESLRKRGLLHAGIAVFAIWILALAVRSELRSFEWKTNLTLFQATTRAVPRSSKAWTNLSLAQTEQKQFDEAIASAERALELYPGYTAAELAMGSALNQAGRPAEAIPHLKATRTALGGRRLDGALALGNAYLLLQQGTQAESTFRSAGTLSKPGDAHWWIGLASSLALQSRWPESRAAWKNAAALSPTDAAVTQRFAYSLWQAGSPDSAETVYRRALELNPTDPGVQNDFAWFLLETRRNPIEARTLAEQALARDPSANVADTYLEAIVVVDGCASARQWITTWTRSRDELRAALEAKLEQRCPEELRSP